MTQSPFSLATSVFLSLEGEGSKRAAMNAAAHSALSGDALECFELLSLIARSAQKERNKIVHWVWGITPELPDSMILIHPKHFAKPGGHPGFAYREADLKHIADDIRIAAAVHARFWLALLDPRKFERRQMIQKLLAEPVVQDRKKASKRKTVDRA